MIYQPQLFFNTYLAIGTALFAAAVRYAADYVTDSGKSWEYYIGYGFGGAALATGIPGANAILYTALAGTYKVFLEKSPGAAQVRIFLDGVENATLDLYDPVIDVLEYALELDPGEHIIMLQNIGSSGASASPEDWLSILAIEAPNNGLSGGPQHMTVFSISATIKDAKDIATARVRNTQSVSVFADYSGTLVADLVSRHDATLAAIDGVTEGVIVDSSLTLFPALPGGLGATAGEDSDVQEGGLVVFSLTGSNYTDAIRIPAIDPAMIDSSGQALISTGAMATLITLLTGGAGSPNDYAAVNRYGLTYASFLRGTKSFRK